MRLSDEAVPAELGKMSMSDINFVAEFLKENFCYDLEDESKSPVSASKGAVTTLSQRARFLNFKTCSVIFVSHLLQLKSKAGFVWSAWDNI